MGQSPSNDTTVVEIVLNKINVYIKNPKSANPVQIANYVSFMTQLTGIVSRSDGNYIGQDSPTEEDYLNWKRWFVLNKEYLFWDEKSQILRLNKSMKVPEYIFKQKN